MMMKCEQCRELFIDWNNNLLTADEQEALQQHIDECAGCREELAELQLVWDRLGEFKTPEPSPAMKVNFQAMLKEYKESENQQRGWWSNLAAQFSNFW